MKIAIAGNDYVDLSNAMLLAQHNEVVSIDIVVSKVAMLNAKQSPIKDTNIERFLQHKTLNFRATVRILDQAAEPVPNYNNDRPEPSASYAPFRV